MASTATPLVPAASAASATTDLAKLWEKAFEHYNEQLAECSDKPPDISLQTIRLVGNIESVQKAVDERSKSFTKYRHDKSTIDKVRTFIGENLGYVQFAGDQVISSASASFPPAGVIWTVATFAIKACQTVSYDFDKLLGLLGETGSFLRSLRIIESKVPRNEMYELCVTECLTSIVAVFAIQTKFMLQSRPMAFVKVVLRGNSGDTELQKAYDDVHAAISKLTTANHFMAVRNSEELMQLMAKFDARVEFDHVQIMAQLDAQTTGIYETKEIVEQNQQALAKVLGLLQIKEDQDSETPEVPAPKTHTSAAYLKVKEFLSPRVDPIAGLVELQRSLIQGTSDILIEMSEYKKLAECKLPYLWICGDTGTGKSHLAYAATTDLRKRHRNQTSKVSVAYFLFREDLSERPTFDDALRAIALQIAAEDRRYSEALASQPLKYYTRTLKENDSYVYTWTVLIESFFRKDSGRKLLLVLDGIDGTRDYEYDEIKEVLERIATRQLPIHVIITSKEKLWPELDGPMIELTPEKCKPIADKIIQHRLQTLPRLSRFRPETRQRISENLSKLNESILYIDRFLLALDDAGSERTVLRNLKSPPKFVATLLEERWARHFSRRDQIEKDALRTLSTWIVWGFGATSLAELNSMQMVWFKRVVIDIEKEVGSEPVALFAVRSSVSQQEDEEALTSYMTEDATLDDTQLGIADLDVDGANSKAGSADKSQASTSNDKEEDDSTLVVDFEDPMMRKFLRGNFGVYPSFSHDALRAALRLFLICTQSIAWDPAKHPHTVNHIIPFASKYWCFCFEAITNIDKFGREQSDGAIPGLFRTEVYNVVLNLMHMFMSEEIVALNLHKYPNESFRLFSRKGASNLKYWLDRALQLLETEDFDDKIDPSDQDTKELGETIRLWVRQMINRPEEFLVPCEMALMKYAFSQVHEHEARSAFRSAISCWLARKGPFENEDVSLNWTRFKGVVEGHADGYQETPRMLRSIAMAWPVTLEEELTYMNRSLKLAGTMPGADNLERDTETFYSLVYLARTKARLDQKAEARDLMLQALKMDIPLNEDGKKVAQLGYGILSIAVEGLDQKISIFETALATFPERPLPKLLLHIFSFLHSHKRHTEMMDFVQRNPQLLLLHDTWNNYYREAARQSGRRNEAIATHKLLLQILIDNRFKTRSARFHLAMSHWRLAGDVSKAKQLFYDILDKGDFSKAISPDVSEDDWMLVNSQISIAEILWSQFYEAETLHDKESFLQELIALKDCKLSRTLMVDDVWGTYDTILARMYMKIGPLSRLADALDGAFKACIAALRDDNPWNDVMTFRQLSKILSCLPGLEEEASTALCLQFQRITNIPDDEAQNEEEYELKYKEILMQSFPSCRNPVCRRRIGSAEKWTKPFTQCLECVDTSICEACIPTIRELDEKLQSKDKAKEPYPFCGPHHARIYFPMASWKGVNDDGMIEIENREPVLIAKWFETLSLTKWPEAWKRYIKH